MSYGNVLLLNGNTWEPLTVVSVPRAINLVLAEKAVVIEESGRFLRSVRARFPVPSVIALKRYVNVPRRHASWSRRGVIARDDFTCIYCGVRLSDVVRGHRMIKKDFTVDHIQPRSRGGRDTWTNTACACYTCNHRKGDRTTTETGMKLRWEPKTPRTSYVIISMGRGPDLWKKYIEVK
jgi:5-methylcytosine-specific restriction endonuclease McrA